MSKADAVAMANEEMRLYGRPQDIIDVRESEHHLEAVLVHSDGRESKCSGLVAVELCKALRR